MVRIAPVLLQNNPRSFWFDPQDLELADGDKVIVTTERGTEYGLCNGGIIEVDEEAVEALKSPLKPVLRVATEEDLEQVEKMRDLSAEALPRFKEMAAEENENMRPVMVEYLFDGEKAVFYFEAEERIDFRELVRKLAAEFKVRVDMRQIGVRDEARMVGGLGHCGQELCCKRLGGEFNPVSIRMAKEQDLSLNPTKISGVCGRLMCCLRYEFEAYKDFKSRAPKQGAKIETPEGTAKVVELNVPREMITVQLEDDSKRVTFPLSAMDEPEEGEKRPKSIGDVFDEYANPDPFAMTTSFGLFDTAGFTREDKLGTPEAHHNAPEAEEEPKKEGSRRRRRRKGQSGSREGQGNSREGAKAGTGEEAKEGQKQSSRRRRRGGQRGRGGAAASAEARTSAEGRAPAEGRSAGETRSGVRPGQKSSSLSRGSQDGASAPTASSHRKSRRRSHKTGSSENES